MWGILIGSIGKSLAIRVSKFFPKIVLRCLLISRQRSILSINLFTREALLFYSILEGEYGEAKRYNIFSTINETTGTTGESIFAGKCFCWYFVYFR